MDDYLDDSQPVPSPDAGHKRIKVIVPYILIGTFPGTFPSLGLKKLLVLEALSFLIKKACIIYKKSVFEKSLCRSYDT